MEDKNSKTNKLIAVSILTTWLVVSHRLMPLLWQESKIGHEGWFYAKFSFFSHEMIWLVFNLFFFILYKFEFSFFEQFKAQKIAWPWYQKETWYNLMISSIKVMIGNHFLVIPLALLPNIFLNRSPYKLNNEFPSFFEYLYQIFFFIVCEDFFFYWTHRLFHIQSLYPLFHKLHHEYQNTISISAEYTHPVEFLIGGILPSQAGPMLMGKRVHIMTYFMWLVLRLWKTTEAHCGYDFPISPFGCFSFSGSSKFHNFHHLHFKGNYGSFFIFWDYFCGTMNKKYHKIACEEKLPSDPHSEEKNKIS